MNTTQHTPGPWLRSKSGNHFQIVAGADLNGEPNELVATIHPIAHNCEHEPCEETKANARLIAAAPDLVESLKGIILIADSAGGHGVLIQRILSVARAAIAKAKGDA